MMRKFVTLLAASAFALATLTPSEADAQRRRGYHNDHYYDHQDRRRGHYRDHDNDGDAVAAGVIGLVLGLALGSLASQPRGPEAYCRDNYQRCAPAQGYYNQGDYNQGYYGQGYYDQGYDPRYPELAGGYDPRYDAAPPQCTRRERQWDRYAQRYVYVDVPC